MISKLFHSFRNLDLTLLLSVFLLVCFGLAEVYSVSASQGMTDLLNFKKQLFFVVLGFIIMLFLITVDYYVFFSYNNYLYLAGVFLLVAVLLFGSTINGTKGWFNLFGFGFQPVELVKFILIAFLAKYFSLVPIAKEPIRHLIITGAGTLVFIILVMLQPDLGSALMLFLIWLIMIVFAGFPKRYLVAIITVFMLLAVISWGIFLKDYQKQRILSFFAPLSSTVEQDYNVRQAIIAVGSGRILGQGLGLGSQSQLRFLPEAKNDFIFAVIAEELGFLGCLLVLGFFGLIFYRLLRSLPKITNDFGIFFVLGVTGLIFIEMFINIGMNMGLLPIIGIGLPFLSYGGSAMISKLIMIGVALSIIARAKIKSY
jgi:rod shape determining protein RodA